MSCGHQLAIDSSRDLVKKIPGLSQRSSVNSDRTTQFVLNALRLQSLMWLELLTQG